MNRKKRFLIGGLVILAALVYLIYFNVQEAAVYFYTPSELKADTRPPKERSLKVGGMVVQGSLKKDLKNLTYRFEITDGKAVIPVYFKGVPPDLFSEGKGAVVEGKMGEDGVFLATTIMAKHSEEYSPPKEGETPHPRSFIPSQEEKRP